MSSEKKDPLFESITTVLSCFLDPSSEAQNAASEKKKILEVVDEYPLVLSDIIASEEAFPERQLASVFLRNYVGVIYKKAQSGSVTNMGLFQKDIGKKLCFNLLEILSTVAEPIKNIVCGSLAMLCAIGFWPQVNPLVLNMLNSGNAHSIDIAASLIKETFIVQFEDILEPDAERSYVDHLLDILKTNTLTSKTRANAVSPMYVKIKALKNNEEVLANYLPIVGSIFEQILNEPYSENSDFHLKCEVIQCLSEFMEEIPSITKISLPACLSAIGNLLTMCCTNYKALVMDNASVPHDASETDIEEPINFYLLVMAIMQFMKSLFGNYYFEILMDDLDNILYCILVFMSCHHDMDKQVFMESYDKGYYFALRTLCVNIIQEIVTNFGTRRPNGRSIVIKNLNNTFQKLSSEIQESNNTLYMVRINEAMMFALGECYNYFDKNGEYIFPFLQYMDYWTSLARTQSNLMIKGRVLWLGATYNLELTTALLNVHLKTLLENLTVGNTYLYSVCAGALRNHLISFQKISVESQMVMRNFAEEMLISILNVAEDAVPHCCILTVLGHYLELYLNSALRHFAQIDELLIRVLCEHVSSVRVMNELNFILSRVASIWRMDNSVHHKFLSLLINVLRKKGPASLKEDEDKVLQLINTYILYNYEHDDLLLLEVFHGAKRIISENCDATTEQALILMTTMLVKASEQLKYLADEKGFPVVHNLPAIIQYQLVSVNDIAGDVPGLLTVVTIYYLPEMMEPHFNSILKHILTTDNNYFKSMRCIWLVFLFICMLQPLDTLRFLSSLPGPSGGSALTYVLGMWDSDSYSSVTNIERQIQVICIKKIIEHCLSNQQDFQRMCDICIRCPGQLEEYTLSGFETLYLHLISILRFQDEFQYLRNLPFDVEDCMMLIDKNYLELFKNHPFNIDIITNIVNFLKVPTPPYFSVLQKVFSQSEYIMLREYGCAVPNNIQFQERME
ncbi:uncharacterized protein LOC132695724 isoform X2 [Cylas formicarius]|uniref:uncharacterized protein LOC132695724 isoform X2 n=1 Tax=Cylas formicarius TaxID=197179 RepID=UPI002958702B|nr:uncharacterized protein LOC132695724 isoform X2 [Cylas formicarius]